MMATALEESQSARTQSWDKKQWGAETQRWDRSKWVTVFSSHNPTIREVTECLGMRLSLSASGTNRGIPKFDAPIFKELSQEIMKMSKEMPKERDLLLDCATDPGLLETQLDEVLDRYGPQIWGKDADRSRLLTPNPEAEKPTYFKDLFYEDLEDRSVIKTWLHRWIVIKACYYIRNRKIKKPSIGEDESLIDVEPYSPIQKFELVKPDYDASVDRSVDRSDSTLSEYKSVTPPTEVGAQQPPTYERKSPETNGHPSHNALAASSGSRKRSRLSPDLAPRKSPRKSLASDVSMTSGPPSSGARTRPPSPVNVRFANTFAAVNRPLASSAEATPTRIAAASTAAPRHSVGGAPSPRTAVHTLPSQPPPGSAESGPSKSTPTANTVPDRTSSFKPVNPLGVTIVPINRSPRRSVSPRDRGGHPNSEPPYARHAGTEPPSHPAAHIARGSPYQERAHLQNQHRQDGPPPGAVPREGLPPISLRDPRAAEAYHPHNAPPGAQYHPHIQPYPHGGPSGQSGYQPHHHSHGHAPAPPQHHRQSVVNHQPQPLPSNGAGADMTLRQCELLGLLMQFFFPRDPSAMDETILLQNLTYIWSYNEGTFRHQLGAMYDLHARVLTTWIEERTRIQQLQHALESNPTLSAPEMVERLLAMNDLRVLRLKWRALTTQDANNRLLSAEDLLCKTFSTMTKTEGTEAMFKNGLQALNERVFEFLRSDDMKISVVGH